MAQETAGIRLLRQFVVRRQAEHDQELMAGADWMQKSDGSRVFDLWMRMNDSVDEINAIREMSDDELHIVRSLAMIGFHEVFKEAFPKVVSVADTST